MDTRKRDIVEVERITRVDPVERIAKLMDEAFRIPGTNFRVGWDAIIGLIPGLGEAIMLFTQCGIVFYTVSKYPVPKVVAARMVVNVLIDSAFGSIPFVGDIFDVFFKANTRNMRLLQQVRSHYDQGAPVPMGRHVGFLVVLGIALVAIIAGALTLSYFMVRGLLNLIGSV